LSVNKLIGKVLSNAWKRINLSVPIQNEEQLDDEINTFIKCTQQAAWENTPELKRWIARNNYSKEIWDLVAEKWKLRKKWQQKRAPTDKTRLNNIMMSTVTN
jgi:hypothetical protein